MENNYVFRLKRPPSSKMCGVECERERRERVKKAFQFFVLQKEFGLWAHSHNPCRDRGTVEREGSKLN